VAVDVVAVLEAVCLDMHAYVYLTFLSGVILFLSMLLTFFNSRLLLLLDMHVCVSELRNTNVYKTKNKNKNKVSEFLHPCKFHSLIYLSFTPHNGCRAASVKIALVVCFCSVFFPPPISSASHFQRQKNTSIICPYLHEANDQLTTICLSQRTHDYRNFMAPCSPVSPLHASFLRTTQDGKP